MNGLVFGGQVKLTIEIDLTRDYGPSSNGNTTVITSTHGAAKVPGHDGISIGLNIHRKRNQG